MIPKIIYLCYKNIEQLSLYSQNWKRLNPEYDIQLFDDKLCKEFLLKEYSQLYVDIFDFIQDGPIKADFWRVCIINKYGGLYVDADIEPLVPLREYIENDDDFVTCISQWDRVCLNPHFILCDKNNKILQDCIDTYIKYYTFKKKYSYWGWGICSILSIGITKKEHIQYINNKKFKFLFELTGGNDCAYKDIVVLHNRYTNYIDHNFINQETKLKICIFNSFPFHYEIFGYIIHFAKQNDYHVDIYTNFNNNLGWFDFYQKKFDNITFINFIEYINGYEYVFVTTDDDSYFKNEWITDNVICINHYYKIRNPNYKKFINLANFLDSKLDYSLACYPIVDVSEKKQNNVVTIIGCRHGINIEIIERLRSSDGKPVILNILGRNVIKSDIKGNFVINCIQNVDTSKMFEILKESSYILLNVDSNKDHNNGKSSSGSLPLLFSCLCKPILSCNKIHKFEHAIEYNESFIKPIFLDNVNFGLLSKQRSQFIQKFNNLIKMDTVNLKYTALIVEPRFLTDLPIVINNFYNNLKEDNWEFVFYCGKGLKSTWLLKLPVGIKIIELDTNNFTMEEYNNFFKKKELYTNLKGDYVLVFQADTWVINTISIDNFIQLNKSYIGGNMNYKWNELNSEKIYPKYRNFNGGLSLRKRIDMIKIIEEYPDDKNYGEDVYFTVGCYKLNLPIGDDEYCSQFVNHSYLTDKCFALHYCTFMHNLSIRYPEINQNKYLTKSK